MVFLIAFFLPLVKVTSGELFKYLNLKEKNKPIRTFF